MKKMFKILGITCGILALVGIVFVGIGLANGGKEVVQSDVIDNRLSFDLEEWFNDYDDDMNTINKESTVRLQKNEYEIDSMEVKAKYGEVEISQWNEEGFGIQNNAKSLNVKYEVSGGILKISVSRRIGISTNHGGEVKVYIPKDKLNSVDVSIGAGEMKCSGVYAENFKIDVGAGEGKIKHSQLENCNIGVGVGEVDVEHISVNNMNVDCGMGEVKADLDNGYREFDYTLKVGAGEIELGNEKYEGLSQSVKLSNGTGRNIDVDCGMGEVKIKFNQ
ncbi:MAG: DUF4097 domain-containing protein [Eubacterium sp.]|jgi:hypothetical protein|nr:DUF4097 domain-containing protein [Eubacterium sp.]